MSLDRAIADPPVQPDSARPRSPGRGIVPAPLGAEIEYGAPPDRRRPRGRLPFRTTGTFALQQASAVPAGASAPSEDPISQRRMTRSRVRPKEGKTHEVARHRYAEPHRSRPAA